MRTRADLAARLDAERQQRIGDAVARREEYVRRRRQRVAAQRERAALARVGQRER